MKNKKLFKWQMVSVWLVAFLFLLPNQSQAFIVANETPILFAVIHVDDLNSEVVGGATYFLKSYSHVLRLLALYEASSVRDVTHARLRHSLNRAVFLFGKSQQAYKRLVAKTAYARRNPKVALVLNHMDYGNFARERGLNGTIFDRLKPDLAAGNVREIYRQLDADIGKILGILAELQTINKAGDAPRVALLWELNQRCAETMLFGQYAAEIFCGIAGKGVIDSIK